MTADRVYRISLHDCDKEGRVYRIYNPETKLYSTGGSYPRWNSIGKVYSRMQDIKRHLKYVERYNDVYKVYKGCEIVSYEQATWKAPVELYI